MQNQTPLASYLEQLCRERGLSLRAASIAAGLGEATLGNVVRGYRHPDPSTLRKISLFFGLSEDALLEMAGHRTVPVEHSRPEISDPELRVYLSPEKINALSQRDLNLLKEIMRHLLEDPRELRDGKIFQN
jgi:transcriptional regulator with XRE-family HTH domain